MKYISYLIFAGFIMASLNSCAQQQTTANKPAAKTMDTPPADLNGLSTATFASGCFWCVEAVFESVKGVKEAVSGYSGGPEENPTYEEVSSGRTGHAETVQVYYDPKEVSYETLLQVYFSSEDPTQVNGQGPDHGPQYRSVIFYNNEAEKKMAEDYKAKLQASGKYAKPIAAEIVPLKKFWEAEAYHQSYVKNNPNQSYVRGESIPRVKEFQAEHPELIKEGGRF